MRLPRWRWFGFAVIATFPVLALGGVFGEVQGTAHAEDGPVRVEVRWPRRARYQERGDVEIVVTNLTNEPVDARVEIDPAWIARYTGPRFSPEPDVLWRFPVALAPGGRGRIVGEIEARHAGEFVGEVLVFAGDATVRVPVDGFVWP